jgi:quercetin dioxygenase-like cupin family protein
MPVRRIIVCLSLLVATVAAAADAPPRETVTVLSANPLPNAPGKTMTTLTVSYPPGGRSLPHHHAPSAFIWAYVLEGRVRSQVNADPARVYAVGESFVEHPGDHHPVSENASATEPAKLLVVFVTDSDDQPLTTPDGP